MDKEPYIIQIDNPFVYELDEKNLIQRDNYAILYDSLRQNRLEFENARDNRTANLDKISSCRTNATYLVTGPRGSGKSVFLNNIS